MGSLSVYLACFAMMMGGLPTTLAVRSVVIKDRHASQQVDDLMAAGYDVGKLDHHMKLKEYLYTWLSTCIPGCIPVYLAVNEARLGWASET